MAKVSIIIPCYKQAKYLPETLDSVLAQTYNDWECIVVNDGSPDNTEEVSRKYCIKDKRFKYIYQENQGPSAARNNGIKKSNGEYILPLDSDDIIQETYIEKAICHFIKYPETKLIYCKANKFGLKNEPWKLPEYKYENLLWDNPLFCTAMYKRADYNKTDGYNQNLEHGLEDWDFFLSLLNENDIVYQINETLFYYRIKEESRTTILINEKHIEESFVTLYNNHKLKYEPYISNIIFLKKMAKKGELYEKVLESHSYRLGNFLLSPFIWIKGLINKST